MATDLKRLAFIKIFDDGSIFLHLNVQGKAYRFQNGEFETYTFQKELVRISDARIKDNGHLMIEGCLNNVVRDRYIFEINKKGQIVKKIETDIPFTAKTSQSKYHFQLKARDELIGGQNFDAFKVVSLTAQPTQSTFNHPIRIEQAKWNNDKQLLWLKNEASFYVTQSNGNLVYQKTLPQDQLEMPILFDGNTTWYSNKQNGLVALTLEPNHFQVYQQFKEGFNNSARGIYTDTKGNIWISTINGVLHKPSNSNTFQYEETLMFTSFLKDRNNQLWSFRERVFKSYDFLTEKEKTISYNTNFYINAWSMYQANNGKIWVYGNGGNHFIFNPTTKETTIARQLPTHSDAFYVYDIQKKDAQSIWLATNQGLYVVNNQGQFIARYNQNQKDEFYLPTNDVHHMYLDKNGTIWLATGDAGLIQLKNLPDGSQVKNEKLTIENQFTTQNGLSCDILHAVYEDDYEYLWLSSNEGLMQFDKRTGKIVTYTTENGLLHNEFNRIAHFQAEDGKLYFGGLTGVVSFHPKHFSQVRHEERAASLVVTDFQQFSAKEGQFKNLTQALFQTETIRLKHNDRFFKMNLALLNFQDDATFQYRIKGLYDWQNTKDSELNISGLPYGKYTLEIKAFNANQYEAANTLTYDIHVLRPFYLQWWFLILVLGSLGTGAFYFLKWRTKQMLVFQETEQLRELDKIKSQFFANISHELRTPITLILAPLAQFLKKEGLSNDYKKELQPIYQNGKSLLSLVNEVLDLSKLEANKLELDLSPTKIPQFIEPVVANFESAAKVKGIEYQFMSFLQKNVVAQFDQRKLEKILNNLLSNALKFTPKNGTIQIVVGQMDNHLIIKVKNSGKGISKEDLPHVFDRYFQSNDKSMTGGTGIGLALVKEFTELMKGEISVQSEFDEGTEFEIKLPIVIAVETLPSNLSGTTTEEYQTKEIFNPILTKVTSNKNKDTILLVEDNPSLLQFIQSVLTPHYNVIVANNGLEALNELHNLSADRQAANCQLILSDVMMPEMDGFTLLEKVKSDDRFCSIPFILLTARADINDKLRGLRIGVDDYMTKPFEVDELLLRIKNLIANAKSRQFPVDNEQLLEQKDINPTTHNSKPATHNLSAGQAGSQPATVEDLTWLKEVEIIAQREIKNTKFKIDDLAAELYMSRRQVFRKIKKVTGLTPNNYIKLLRLQTAKRMLETEDIYTLTEVCNAIGLENTTHFAKAYEAEFGKRPHNLLTKEVNN